MFTLNITYSWNDREVPITGIKSFKKAWKKAKKLAINEADNATIDRETEIGLTFDQHHGTIILEYKDDKTKCFYQIIDESSSTDTSEKHKKHHKK